jgi:23S rRNA (cytidine1920-2'-O)/16S rRNA (cytidine1409-2'-O)-methyltransferase
VIKFVSRAGQKLKFALDNFKISSKGLICGDFGSSTGGFTGYLLENGAERVYSVDTSYGELDWNLRNDPRVVVLERTNAMHVKLPEKVDLITIDVGWTKQENVLPNALKNLNDKGKIISLIKPHYEAPKHFLRRGKLLEDKIDEVVGIVKKDINSSGGKLEGLVKSPIVGGKGKNIEFLALISKFS